MSEILTVSALTQAIKQQLEMRFTSVHVQGEISNARHQSSGHFYFTLKDHESQIAAVLFKGSLAGLERIPKEGDQVILKGQINVYAPRGNYQIIVKELQYAGVGLLLQKLHALKLKLQGLGWFDPALKKKLPKFPQTIGVVTSPTGSVILDIIHILSRRYPGFHLILNPVRVQGELAAKEIAQAIEQFNRHQLADVLIVGRGGGSLEDLWPFNEEIVAKAIRESKIPVVSAVGHETDFSISDFVADLRAPTPSAAAELVTVEKQQQLLHLDKLHQRLSHTLGGLVQGYRKQLQGIKKHPLLASPYALIGEFAQKLDDMKEELISSLCQLVETKKLKLITLQKQHHALRPTLRLMNMRTQLGQWQRQLQQRMHQMLHLKKQHFNQLVIHLKAIDPKNLLQKGYAIVFNARKDAIIFSTNEVEITENLSIQLHDGALTVEVQEKHYGK